MPNTPIVGVRVTRYFRETGKAVTLHDAGREVRREDDGALTVFDEDYRAFVLYQPGSWDRAELVYGEPIEDIAVTGRLTLGAAQVAYPGLFEHRRVDPAERAKLEAIDKIVNACLRVAERDVEKAREAQVATAMDCARAVMDAERALFDLRRELGEAA